MSRKLPCCAYCGEPLARAKTGRILFEFIGNLGNPAIGWHTRPATCSAEDLELVGQAVEEFKVGNRNGVPECVIQVWGRGRTSGPLRVSLMGEKTEAFEKLIARQETAKKVPNEQFPSPCCGKPSAWEPGDFRRCPCGHRWRP